MLFGVCVSIFVLSSAFETWGQSWLSGIKKLFKPICNNWIFGFLTDYTMFDLLLPLSSLITWRTFRLLWIHFHCSAEYRFSKREVEQKKEHRLRFDFGRNRISPILTEVLKHVFL